MSVMERINELAKFSADLDGVTRLAWTKEMAEAQDWLIEELTKVGLEGSRDAAGNVIGRWQAGKGKAVAIGSHLDSVRHGGRFDGALGVVCGLEALRILRESAIQPSRPIVLLAFNDEEGGNLGTPHLGSRAFTGDTPTELWREAGVPAAMDQAGYDFEAIGDARGVDDLAVYLELHVEQGPVLFESGVDIGIVDSIAGGFDLRVTYRGEANHAGGTPMSRRRDSLVGASRAITCIRDKAAEDGEAVGTVGQIKVSPGALNVVPGLTEFSIDMRSAVPETFVHLETWVRDLLRRIAGEEGLDLEIEELHRVEPTPLDPGLQRVLKDAAQAEGATVVTMSCLTGHDAMRVAKHIPAGLLFVPSRDGIGHCDNEYTDPRHCELGARILARAVKHLVTE